MNVNRYTCTGRLTRSPELRELPSGNTVCELRVAVEAMGRGGEPGFITVSVYGRPGEAAAEHLDKGWLVAVDGRLVFGEWETSTGEKRREHAVIGNVEFLAAPRTTPAEQEEPASSRRRPPVAA